MPAKIATAFRSPLGPGFTLTQRHNTASKDDYQKDGPDLEYHLGEDLANGRYNDPVFAAANGTVVYAQAKGSFGNVVAIEHKLDDGKIITTIYGHLSYFSVAAGDIVEIGDPIGGVGNTGSLSSGPHLHFGVYFGTAAQSGLRGFSDDFDPDIYNSGYVDPSYFLKNFRPPVLDTTAPKLVDSLPDEGARKVALDANIVLIYDENVVAGSGKIEIRTKAGKVFESFDVATSSRVNFEGDTITINPKGKFAANTEYYVTYKKGVIEDAAGNDAKALTSSGDVKFKTGLSDTTAPKLLDSSPDGGARKVALDANIVLIYDENVVAGSGKIEIRTKAGKVFESFDVATSSRVDFDGNTVTINPKGKFAANTEYYVTYKKGVVEDAAGNDAKALTSSGDVNFKTTSKSSKQQMLADDAVQTSEAEAAVPDATSLFSDRLELLFEGDRPHHRLSAEAFEAEGAALVGNLDLRIVETIPAGLSDHWW